MAELKIRDLAQLLELESDKQLGDPTLGPILIQSEVEEKLPLDLGAVTFTVGGQAAVSILNDENDLPAAGQRQKDPVLGPRDEKDDLDLGPQIAFSPSHAWIRYDAGIRARGSGTATAGVADFSLGIESEARLISWKRHPRTKKLGAALATDLGTPRFALSYSDVQALSVGDALAFEAAGSLSGHVEIQWADAISAGLTRLTHLLGADRTIRLNLNPQFSASLRVTVDDGFLLTFARPVAGKIRVGIKKLNKSNLAASVRTGIRAEFEDPTSLDRLLQSMNQDLFGATEAKIDALLTKATLSAADRQLLETIAERFGIDRLLEPVEKIDAIRARWGNWKVRVRETLTKLAIAKVEVGFAYEYSRIATDATVFQFLVEDSKLRPYHRDLIRGDIDSALVDLRAGKAGLTPERFLNQKTLEIRKAWGLTLGIGNLSLSGKDRKEIDQISRENQAGEQKISFRGLRRYDGRFLGNAESWYVDFAASLPNFLAAPSLADFRFGLTLTYAWQQKKLSDAEIQRLVDHGVMWRAVATEDQDDLEAEMRKRLSGKRDLELRMEIRLSDAAVRAVLDRVADAPEERFGKALATAMPWNRDRVRRDLWQRRLFYGDLWQQYLESPNLNSRSMARRAEAKARDWGFAGMAAQERDDSDGGILFTLGGTINRNASQDGKNRNTRTRYREMRRGLEAWSAAVQPGAVADPSQLRSVFRDLSRFWVQSHHTRAFGVYLLDLVREIGAPAKDGVERVLTINHQAAGNQRNEWVISQS